MTHLSRALIVGCSVLALAACGPEDFGSPGSNGDINIGDIITGGGTPTPTPTPTSGLVTAADNCPDLGASAALTESGTISGPTGEYLVCTLPSVFTTSVTLPYAQGVMYQMLGRVDVGRDDGATADASDGVTGLPVELTIEPGVRLFGAAGVSGGSFLVVQRGSKLFSDGTVDRPIIFTSESNVRGNATETTSSEWGGVVLLGRAPVSDCAVGGVNPADRTTCFMRIEGIADNIPVFGGNTPADNSGSISYTQIRYSGFLIGPGNELQSLTLGGVGSGTNLDHIQSFNSSDDGTEWFGGRVNMKHLVVVGAEDDSIDVDNGVQGNLQYAVVVQRQGVGDRVIESDSPDSTTTSLAALPRTLLQVSNFTFYADSASSTNAGTRAIESRGASDITLSNGVLFKPFGGAGQTRPCVSTTGETADGRAGIIKLNSVLLDCNIDTVTQSAINAGTAAAAGTNTLASKFINGASETAFTPVFDATTLSSFFAAATVIGAVPTPSGTTAPWTRGWTCDSATVSFGSSESCLSIPNFGA